MTFAMSMSNLSIDGEFRYIIQWFNEWSELQRDDFIPVLVDCLNQDALGVVYMNGVVNAVANAGIADRPMSLFQCRIKLFREWTPKWSPELKNKLKEKIIEIDAKVGEKIINEIKGEQNATQTNGPATIEAAVNVPGTANRDSVNSLVTVPIQDAALDTVNNIDETATVNIQIPNLPDAVAAVATNEEHEEPAGQHQIALVQDHAANSSEVPSVA